MITPMEAGNYDIVASIRRARPRRETHGPLATKIAQVRRYVQCHPLSAYRDGRQPIYDGVALTWFDNTADMREKPPEYRAIRRDEPNFLELRPENIIITKEHVII